MSLKYEHSSEPLHISATHLVFKCLTNQGVVSFLLFTLKLRVEGYTKSMSLKYEHSSEPLHISAKQLVLCLTNQGEVSSLSLPPSLPLTRSPFSTVT